MIPGIVASSRQGAPTPSTFGLVDLNNTVYASAASQAIILPTHDVGDVIVVLAVTTNGGTLSSSAGWNHTNYLNWGSYDAFVTWKVAASSAETLTISSTMNCAKTCSAFVIRGADTEAGVNSGSSGGTATVPDPPAVSMPGVGAGDGIALVVAGQQSQTGRTTGPPSGYTAGVIPDGYNRGGSAYKFLTGVTSEDPPPFTGTAASVNVGLTAIVRAA